MFASFSALASLLMLASSVAQDTMIPFTYTIVFNITDSDANELTNHSTTILENCIVSSFNAIHDPTVIKLYDANITELDIAPMSSHILNGDKEDARLTSKGEGTYSVGGSGGGVGGSCRRCLGLGDVFFVEWQNALDACLVSSNGAGLDGVTDVKVAAQIVKTLEDAQDDMVPFEFTIDLTATDPDSNMITQSSKTVVEGCFVSSFNGAHESKEIQLNDAMLTKIEIKPTTMTLLRGSLISKAHYSLSGGASCVGSCNRWNTVLGSSFFVEWQNALDTCIANSGVDGLDGVTDVTVTLVSSDAAASEQ